MTWIPMNRIALFIGAVSLVLSTGCGGCGENNNPDPNNSTANNTTNSTANNTANNSTTNNTTNNTTCNAGDVGCACGEGDSCNGDAMCSEGMCVSVVASGLTIVSEDARACELLIEERDGAKVLGVDWAEGNKGALRRRAPRVALAITRTADDAFKGGVASLQVNGEVSSLSIETVRCFDNLGNEIEGASASLE